MAEDNHIIDEGWHSYFVQMPYLIDDSGLSVYAVRLYFHIKRRAGDIGTCWESTTNMALACKMARGTVSNAKQELYIAGLISITNQHSKHGGKDYHEIRIIDIWAKNKAKYTSSPSEQPYPSSELTSPPGEPKYIPGSISTNEGQGPLSGNKNAANAALRKASQQLKHHSILQIIHEETGYFPRWTQYQYVINLFGGDNADLLKVRASVRMAMRLDWKYNNYIAMAKNYKEDWRYVDYIRQEAYEKCLEEIKKESCANG